MTEPKKRGRPASTKPIQLDGYRITVESGTYRIYSGSSLLYATDDEFELQKMCRLIEQSRK